MKEKQRNSGKRETNPKNMKEIPTMMVEIPQKNKANLDGSLLRFKQIK